MGRRRLGHLGPALFFCGANLKTLSEMFRFSEMFRCFQTFGNFQISGFDYFSFSLLFYLSPKNTLVAAGSCKSLLKVYLVLLVLI